MRAAIYARMSTDKQSADSPADQVARCREFAARRGLDVVDSLVLVDAGISGASRHDRPGLLGIMERIAEWDVLLCFDSSRLARDEEDFGWILNQIEEHGRTGYEASTGQDLSSFGTRIMGVVNAEERRKIGANTRRGLECQVERGFAPGAVPYGYRTERTRGEGEPKRDSLIVVVPEQAEVVRRIFGLYAAGDGIKAIAHRLNGEGVPPPRPRAQRRAAWSPNAIREMLRNPLYRGELVWNRSRWVKPRRGPRRRIERLPSEWKCRQDEGWRIVSDALWSAVRDRIAERKGTVSQGYAGRCAARPTANAPAKHLLSGFLACAECGGGFASISRRDCFACTWRWNRGATVCSNGLRVPRLELEERVLGAIREQILIPEHVAYVVERTLAIVEERQAGDRLAQHRARLVQLGREIEALLDLAGRTAVEELAPRLQLLEDERRRLRAELAAASVTFEADVLWAAVEAQLADLRGALSGHEHGRRALAALLRSERLRVAPDAERGFRVEGTAWLSVPLESEGARRAQPTGRQSRLVAGEGFEPPTSGL